MVQSAAEVPRGFPGERPRRISVEIRVFSANARQKSALSVTTSATNSRETPAICVLIRHYEPKDVAWK